MGINFGSDTECVAVGANFSWEPFFIPSECCTTFGFSTGKVFFGKVFFGKVFFGKVFFGKVFFGKPFLGKS